MKIKIAAAVLAFLGLSQPWTAGAADQPKPAPPAAAAAPATAHPLTPDDVASWADGLIPYSLQTSDIAGAVVVVVMDGQVLFERGYGYADVKTHKPVDPRSTLFRPGSNTKLFTWTAVMQLKEAGKLDLDTDVNRYLDFKIPDYRGQPITMRNLMTHTPGFEERLKYISVRSPTPSFDTYIKSWVPRRVLPPGKIPAYSNYGAALAGYIVQRVSGQRYADYVQQHILDPLGMAHSTVREPMPPALAAGMSTGYRQASQPPGYLEFITPAPAGSLAATGDDMGKFMIAQLQNGAYGNTRILKAETAVEMHTSQPKFYPALNGQALGFYENSRNGHRIIAHDGGTQFFLSDLHLFLDDGVGIFISLNSDGKPGSAFAIHEAFFHGFADRYFPSNTPQPPSIDKATALKDAKLMAAHQWENPRRAFTSFLSITALLGPTTFKANSDGTLSRAGPDAPRLREIAPFVWRDDKTAEMMQAVVKKRRADDDRFQPGAALGAHPGAGLALAVVAHARVGNCPRRALAERPAVAGACAGAARLPREICARRQGGPGLSRRARLRPGRGARRRGLSDAGDLADPGYRAAVGRVERRGALPGRLRADFLRRGGRVRPVGHRDGLAPATRLGQPRLDWPDCALSLVGVVGRLGVPPGGVQHQLLTRISVGRRGFSGAARGAGRLRSPGRCARRRSAGIPGSSTPTGFGTSPCRR